MSDRDSGQNKDNDQPGEDPLNNLFGMLFGAGGANRPGAGQFPAGGIQFDASMLGPFLSQLQGMMGQAGSANDIAAKTAAARVPTPDPSVTDDTARSTHDAFRLAELWLEKVTDFTVTEDPRSLTRKEWAQGSVAGWVELADPIHTNMTDAMNASLEDQIPEEMRGFVSSMTAMMKSMSSSLFGAQVGEALGTLSGSVLTGSDYNLPILNNPALIEANIAGAAAEMDLDPAELRIYLACTELAKRALFASTPWLDGHIRTALAKYAANIEIDSSHIQDLASRVDPSNLQNLTSELKDGLFKPVSTEAGEQAKASLTRIVSTVAAWADVVAFNACEILSSREEIREALRRRATTKSDTENSFSQLIGLDLTPSRLRDAAALFTYLESNGGPAARDAVFSHPDALPTEQDLADPLGYLERRAQKTNEGEDDMDAALRRLLDEGA